MSYFKDPISISSLLKKSLYNAVGPKTADGLIEIQIIKLWRYNILGPIMSRYSINESFDSGVLTVRIKSSILRNDLFLQRSELIDRINVLAGRKLVYAIVLR